MPVYNAHVDVAPNHPHGSEPQTTKAAHEHEVRCLSRLDTMDTSPVSHANSFVQYNTGRPMTPARCARV